MELKQSKVFILVPQMYVQNVCVKKFAPLPPPKHASQKNELHIYQKTLLILLISGVVICLKFR